MATIVQTVGNRIPSEMEMSSLEGLDRTSANEGEPEDANQLEPTDRGALAWKLLCAAFMFEAVMFGECLASNGSDQAHNTTLSLTNVDYSTTE